MKTILALAAFVFTALSLTAHDTWLQPSAFATAHGAEIALRLTSAHGFKVGESGPHPDRVERAFLRLGDQTSPLVAGPRAAKFLPFAAQPTTPGHALLAVELKPRDLELKPDSVAAYLDELHAGPELRAAWEQIPAPRRWRERYTKYAATFVRVGAPDPADRSWAQPAGLGLEFVPQLDPTSLRVGDRLFVQVLKDGQPLPGLTLGFVAAGETSRHTATTDAAGLASAPLDQPGPWLVHGIHIARSTQSDLEWESLFSTLVIEVAPAR